MSTGPENTGKTSNTILWDYLYLFDMLNGDIARCQFCSVFRLYSGAVSLTLQTSTLISGKRHRFLFLLFLEITTIISTTKIKVCSIS